jgi:hypothetical protein
VLAALHFISQAPQSGQSVIVTSWAEVLAVFTLGTVVGACVTLYRHTRCSQSDCRNCFGLRRHGRYPHGHLKLCHVHHPDVPDDGRVTAEHIARVTKRTPTR